MALNTEAGSELGISLCHTYFGSLYERAGQYDKATEEYETAYQMMQTSMDDWHALNSLIALAGIHSAKGDGAKTLEYLAKAKATAERIASKEHLAEIHTLYYKHYKRLGDYHNALTAYEQATAMQDSVLDMEKVNRIQNTSLSIERNRREREISEARLRMERERTMRYVGFIVSGVVLLVLAGVLVVVLYTNRLRRRNHLALKRLAAVRENFFTNLTHEFRTPLTVILGATSRLQRGELAAGETPASLYEMITRQGRSLLTLINQLLDISKVKSSIGHPDWRRGNIVTFTRMLVATHQEWAKAKHIDIQFASKENDIEMDFVPDYVRKVINNLLSNSIKYTPNHGSIYVTLARSGTDLRVRVADTGRGIDPEELPHIFDAFYQGANNTEHVGTGVGLALVKQIVTSMHGEIEVSSQLGQGTVFTILQSLRQAGHKKLQPLDTTAPLPAEPAHPLLEESDIVLPQGLANADDNSRTAPLVLIVEDDRDVAYYIGAQLQQRYSLRYASDGNEGLALAQELMPDLVITDLMMHGCDGFELCQKMHESEALNHIPIIILTAKTADEDRIRGISAGADYYMTKPFNSEELAVRVDHLIEQRRLLRKKYSQAMIQDKASDVQLSKYDRDFINKLADLVHAQMPKGNVDVETIASRLCMSTKQLRSKVMTITGQNPNAYILQLRMNKARRLLASTQAPIGDIAMQCGFDDSAYFSRVFKQLFKTTPSQYRKSQ